jgi:hypothetical protein
MKRSICTVLSLLFCAVCFSGCEMASDMKTYTMPGINFTQSLFDKGERGNDVIVTVPGGTVKAGEKLTATAKINSLKALPAGKEAVYFVIDWGDGSWSYQGPGLHGVEAQTTIILRHTYVYSGEFKVSATAYAMQSLDYTFRWSADKSVRVLGETQAEDYLIKTVKPISSKPYSSKFTAKNIAGGKGYFKSKPAADIDDEQYAGYLFDEIYTLDKIEIKIPSQTDIFPSNIAIEYTADGGNSWHALPKYYYLYDYSKGRFTPIMNFPNPKGATLTLSLDGIVADGIRITGKLASVKPGDADKERCLFIEDMRVYGSLKTLLYSSMGEEFNAALNNMWTIYGTAKTEPVVLGTIRGENTNQSPFRTGSAMIASTEWLEWSGNKFNFTDYADAREVYFNQLKQVRVGEDGWSDNSGYVWATEDAKEHLNLGNHYSLNPIFILAARNYLLQGNEVGEFNDDDTFTPFMDIENRRGQSMRYRIDKAMDYMMTTLNGKSGLMTILDPEKDGTPDGMSSNYWDTHRSFGYISSYENALFYASLLAYADIAEFEGNIEKAAEYRAYAKNTKTLYNSVLWNKDTGRFVSSVTKDGEKPDFGMTFVNFMAASYGVADESRAKDIYDWVDGKRIVEGDTSTGADIYGRFTYAARSNTLDVSTVGPPYYWYDHKGALPPTPGTLGGFGNQMQNGGAIFYISHYDMLGRIKTVGTQSAFKCFEAIINEFRLDELRRNAYTEHGEYVEGILGEFPESGLVPYTFISGFLGINPGVRGLEIRPNLPNKMEYAGISRYQYGNRTYSIKLIKGLSAPNIEIHSGVYYVELPAGKDYAVTPDNRLIEL